MPDLGSSGHGGRHKEVGKEAGSFSPTLKLAGQRELLAALESENEATMRESKAEGWRDCVPGDTQILSCPMLEPHPFGLS